MNQPEIHSFQVGDRVRVVADLPMARTGEQGRITAIYRDTDNSPRSLTVLIDHDSATTRGITVLPREIAAVEKEDVELPQS